LHGLFYALVELLNQIILFTHLFDLGFKPIGKIFFFFENRFKKRTGSAVT